MDKILNRSLKFIVIGLGISIISCLILFISYKTLVRIDQISCFEKSAKLLRVSPTYKEISDAIYTQAQAILATDMNHDEVITALEEIAPVRTTNWGVTISGGFDELTEIEICSFYENDVLLLISYTKAGKLENVRLYIDD
jgi:hypothetical protein